MRFRNRSMLPGILPLVVLGLVVPGVAAPAAAQPSAPTNLVATPFWSGTEGGVRLDWEYPESQSPRFSPAWEYQYRYRPLTGTYPQDGRPDGWPSGWTDLTGDTPGQFPSGAARTGTVLNLTRQGFYQIRLRVKAGGGSPAGAHATADEVAVSSSPELPPIARLVATGGDGFVTLDWRDYPPLNLATGEEVRWDWRRRLVGGPWAPFSTRDVGGRICTAGDVRPPLSLPATVRRIELRNVEAGRTYEYQLRIRRAVPVFGEMGERTGTACYHGRVSPTSNPVTPGGAGSLQPPTGLVVSSTRSGTLTVSWTPPSPPPFQYLVQYATREREAQNTVWRVAGTPPGTTDTFTLSGLRDGEPYTIRVCSQGPDGTPPPPQDDGSGEHCAVTQGTAGLPNKPPEVGDVNLDDLTLTVNSAYVVSLVGVFTDPDGDTLTYTTQSSDPTLVSVSDPAQSTTFTISALKIGIVRITVVARDEANPTRPAVRTFNVTVEPPLPNQPPVAGEAEFADRSVPPGVTAVVDLAGVFDDPEDDDLYYTVSSERGDVAIVRNVNQRAPSFELRAIAAGESRIVATADDRKDGPGRPARRDFLLTVERVAPSHAPAGVAATLSGTADVVVRWTLLDSSWNAHYDVRISAVDAAEDAAEPDVREDVAAPPVTFTDLEPGDWSVQVRAENDLGPGPWSDPVTATVPVPPLLTVGFGSVVPVYDPDQCASFEPYSLARGRLDVVLSRPARYAVTGLFETMSEGQRRAPDGGPWVDLRGGRCPGASQGCFRIPAGETVAELTLAFSCEVVEQQLVSVMFSEDMPPMRAGSRPREEVAITPGKGQVDLRVGIGVPALPVAGVVFLAFLLGAVAWVRGRAAGQRW